jgi:hypothetical protein
VYATHAPRPLLWRALATNSAVLTGAALLLAVSPATVSFPIAVAEALVLGGGLAVMVVLNLVLLPRAVSTAARPADAPRDAAPARERVGPVLIGWTGPQHLAVDEAERWLRAELARVLAEAGVEIAHLSRVHGPSARHGAPFAWLLELDVPAGRDLETWFGSAAWRDWLGDLHTLGLRPAVMVADHRRVLAAEPD